jgi:hypothetical protein
VRAFSRDQEVRGGRVLYCTFLAARTRVWLMTLGCTARSSAGGCGCAMIPPPAPYNTVSQSEDRSNAKIKLNILDITLHLVFY